MNTITRCMALSFLVTVNVGMTDAADHPSSFGEYATAVNESRLFVTDKEITTLRCDLFFSAAASDQKWFAPKGSVVNQSVPSFVWQYSGLLPVTDYLKTVAIHSVSSDTKENAWQDVQLAFYNGLRAEGVQDPDAKIAYAGAYAFAPRWPLVELIDITVPERDKETRLYKVNYVPASTKGVSIEEYQALARDILADSNRVSLQDIRGIVDAADASVKTKQGVVGGSINDLFASNRKVPAEEPVVEAMPDEKVRVQDPLEDLFTDDPILSDTVLPAEIKPEMVEEALPEVSVEVDVEVPEMDVDVDQPEVEAEPAMPSKAILGPEEVTVTEDKMVDGVEVETDEGAAVTVDTELGAQPTVWKILPDGSAVLVQIEG